MRKKIVVKKEEGFPKRVVKKFLWLPKVIQNEQRWLEIAEWEEKYESKVATSSVWFEWTALRWLND